MIKPISNGGRVDPLGGAPASTLPPTSLSDVIANLNNMKVSSVTNLAKVALSSIFSGSA